MRRPRGARAAGTAAARSSGRTGGAEQPQQHVAAPERDDGGHHDRRQTPHPVVRPGHRRDRQPEQRDAHQREVASPAANTRRAAQTVSPRTAKQTAVHTMKWVPSTSPGGGQGPAAFWLVLSVASPIRSVWRTVAVQYSQESFQPARNRARSPPRTRPAPRAPRAGLAAARNTAGTPPASASARSPGPPGFRGGHGVRRQAVGDHQVIRTTLIWPKEKLPGWARGTSCPAPPCRPPASRARSHGGSPTRQILATSGRVSTIHIDTSNSRQVTTLIATLAACNPTSASGANAIAASGG